MSPTTATGTTGTSGPDSDAIADLRRRVEKLEARMDGLGQGAKPDAPGAKRGWRVQVGAFGDDPVYVETVRLSREWREALILQEDQERPQGQRQRGER